MDVTVREAVPADRRAVRDVHLASIEGFGGEAYDERQVEAWAHDRSPDAYPIETPETYFVVAAADDRVVGFGWLQPDAGDYFERPVDGEITAVYVHPSVARRGVGSRLYDALEAHARNLAVESLGLWASRNAVPFYEAKGYRRVTEHVHEFHDGVEGTVVEMCKSLA